MNFTGNVEYGAKLSLSFGSISIQPSEFVKLTYLFFISGCIVTYKDMRGFLFSTIGAALHVLVLVFSKDLGTAMIFLVAYVFIIFIAYKNYIVLSLEFIVAIAGGIFAYNKFMLLKIEDFPEPFIPKITVLFSLNTISCSEKPLKSLRSSLLNFINQTSLANLTAQSKQSISGLIKPYSYIFIRIFSPSSLCKPLVSSSSSRPNPKS